MLADHAARVLAGSASLGAEARRAGGDADRQLRLVGDVLTHEIGQRNFGGGDEPELLNCRENRTRMLWVLNVPTSIFVLS